MFDNVRAHSRAVAAIAWDLAKMGEKKGIRINSPAVRASALLHDLAKTYCLKYAGAHAMLGASWIIRETGNYNIAQGALLHVHWPWSLPEGEAICCLPILVLYADKRVMHDSFVSLDERFEDLFVRYGHTAKSREGIALSREQAEDIEKRLSLILGANIGDKNFFNNLAARERTL